MDKRGIDEQLKGLQFDMDDQIDDRNERRGWQPAPARNSYLPMESSHAVIMAAIIIVGGLWGGKLMYDYIQEQRMKAALKEVAKYMDDALKDLDKITRQVQSDLQARADAKKALNETRVIERQQRLEEVARLEQEKRLQSALSQFWWQQNEDNPSSRSSAKKKESCGI